MKQFTLPRMVPAASMGVFDDSNAHPFVVIIYGYYFFLLLPESFFEESNLISAFKHLALSFLLKYLAFKQVLHLR